MGMVASMILVPQIGRAISNDDLISYWDFEETSGTRADLVGTNDLTDNNTVGSGTGINGTGAQFDSASSEYLSIADASQTDLDFAIDTSINLWVYDDNSTYFGLFQHNYEDLTGYSQLLDHASAGYMTWWTGSVSNTLPKEGNNAITLNNDEWSMFTITYDATSYELCHYINAVEVNCTTLGDAIEDTSSPVIIGAHYWTGTTQLYHNGLIDEVSAFNIVLSQTDIDDLYNSGTGLFYPFASSTGTTTASTTELSGTDELRWTIELYLALFSLLIFTYVGYRFTKVFI